MYLKAFQITLFCAKSWNREAPLQGFLWCGEEFSLKRGMTYCHYKGWVYFLTPFPSPSFLTDNSFPLIFYLILDK